MGKRRDLIESEPLDVKHTGGVVSAVFKTVATPRKVVERIVSMPQSAVYSVYLLWLDGAWNPISETEFRSLKFPKEAVGVMFTQRFS